MSSESKDRLELKVTTASGWGLIQCEADGQQGSMAQIVRRLAQSLPYPQARPEAGEQASIEEALRPHRRPGERIHDTLARLIRERNRGMGFRTEKAPDTTSMADEGDGIWSQGHESEKATGEANATDRLRAIIEPDRKDPVDMAWVEAKVRGLVKIQQEHTTPDAARDAVLEEAAVRATSGSLTLSPDAQLAAMAIRALKSTPDTEPPVNPGELPAAYDFWWALAQAESGKIIRLSTWVGFGVVLKSRDLVMTDTGREYVPTYPHLKATNWEVVP